MTRRAFVSAILRASLALLLVVLVGGANTPAAAQGKPGEYDVKAELLYRLTRVFEWPEAARVAPDQPIRVGVLGHDPFDGALEEKFEGKPSPFGSGFTVVPIETLEDALRCHIVFVPRDVDAESRAQIPALRRASILLVGEQTRFAERDGGILAIVPDGRKTAMILNMASLAESGLQASSRFLRLCRIVGDEAR